MAVVTGANTGLGRHVALRLAARGTRVILAGRSRERTAPVLDEIAHMPGATTPRFVELDLASLGSVRSAAKEILSLTPHLHLLVNNAGLGGVRGSTEDGFEIHFGVNHLGHFLLTHRLLDRLRESAPARVVTVASNAHYRARGLDFDAIRRPTRTLLTLREYAASKLANVLFSLELGRRLEGSGVAAVSVHPGTVATDIWRRIPRPLRGLLTHRMLSPEDGAAPVIRLAEESPEGGGPDGYFDRFEPRPPSSSALDEKLAGELWSRSEEWVL